MAEDLAREIIAQSASGSKLAFSFGYRNVLLYISRGADEKILYHVHERRSDETEQYYVFNYADLESAADLVYTLTRAGTHFHVTIVMYNNGINCEEVITLGKVGRSNLVAFLQDRVKLLDAVSVTRM